ncbi:MAG: N-acetyltransferase family protein [Thermoguttaceae bacterium]
MIELRECTTADFDQVVGLLKQLWPDVVLDIESLRATYWRAVSSENCRYICATADGRLVAFCSLNVRDSLWQQGLLGHVDELAVDAGFRRQGIGTRLLDHAAILARNLGCLRIELDSALHREDAHRFYERLGFENRAYLFSKCLAFQSQVHS